MSAKLKFLLYDKNGKVATLTLNRPDNIVIAAEDADWTTGNSTLMRSQTKGYLATMSRHTAKPSQVR